MGGATDAMLQQRYGAEAPGDAYGADVPDDQVSALLQAAETLEGVAHAMMEVSSSPSSAVAEYGSLEEAVVKEMFGRSMPNESVVGLVRSARAAIAQAQSALSAIEAAAAPSGRARYQRKAPVLQNFPSFGLDEVIEEMSETFGLDLG